MRIASISFNRAWEINLWADLFSYDDARHPAFPADLPSISVVVYANLDGWDDEFREPRHPIEDLDYVPGSDTKAHIRHLVVEAGEHQRLNWCRVMEDITVEDWKSTFEAYTGVEAISVTGAIGRTLCMALASPCPFMPPDPDDVDVTVITPPEFALFPNLTHIDFHEVDFNTDHPRQSSRSPSPYSFPVYKPSYPVGRLLEESLSHRHRVLGTRLTLVLRQCAITAFQVEGLETVADVDWDSVESPLAAED